MLTISKTPIVLPKMSRSRVVLFLWAFLMISIASIITLPQRTVNAIQPTTQPVGIVVRDGAGNPLMGIAILIKIDDPPVFEDHDKCLTGEDGSCIVDLLPNTYRIQFLYGWRDQLFIPVEEQEVFTLSVIPRDQIGYNFFVIAERDGQLVPVWDMARDPSQPPEPFLPSFNGEDPLADLNLGPIDADLEWASTPAYSPADPGITPTVQVFVDEMAPGVAVAPATSIPTLVADASKSAVDGNLMRGLFGLLFALAAVVMVVLLVIVIANRPGRKER